MVHARSLMMLAVASGVPVLASHLRRLQNVKYHTRYWTKCFLRLLSVLDAGTVEIVQEAWLNRAKPEDELRRRIIGIAQALLDEDVATSRRLFRLHLKRLGYILDRHIIKQFIEYELVLLLYHELRVPLQVLPLGHLANVILLEALHHLLKRRIGGFVGIEPVSSELSSFE